MNYYEHHLGDYDGATAHLSWLEDCAYRRLICLYYRNEAPIPADMKQACRLVRATSKPERDAVQQVLAEFFQLLDGVWHHRRCDADLERFHEKSRKARASVSKRWANRDANEMPSHNERNTNVDTNVGATVLRTQYEGNTPRARPQSPDTKHQTPGKEYTPPDGGGAGAPPVPSDVIFGRGVPLLTAAGVADRNARSMLGLMRKTHGDAAVVDALQRCAEEKPLQPVAWLQAALKQRGKAGPVRRGHLTDAELADANAASTAEAARLLGFDPPDSPDSPETIDA